MLTLDNAVAPFLDLLQIPYFKNDPKFPPALNHALRHFSNYHCHEYVKSFCAEHDVDLEIFLTHIEQPGSLQALLNIDLLIESVEINRINLLIEDTLIHPSFDELKMSLPIEVVPILDANMLVSSLEEIDNIEFSALANKRDYLRVDNLSLAKDVGFVTASLLKNYIDTSDRHYLYQALPHLLEGVSTKISNVLRHLENESFDKLPPHISHLVISVENSLNVTFKDIIDNLVRPCWPLTTHRYELLLNGFSCKTSVTQFYVICCDLFNNPPFTSVTSGLAKKRKYSKTRDKEEFK